MESRLYFWHFSESKKSKQFNWQWINYITSCHSTFGQKTLSMTNLPACTHPAQSSLKCISQAVLVWKCQRWISVAVWCSHPGTSHCGFLHPLPASCSPSHHTSFWLRKYFGLGESEWSFWLWGCCTVWCAKPHQLSFAAFLLGNTWDHVTYPSQDVSSHLCCCCAVTEKCCHLEEHIFACRLESFLWVCVNDFSKYLCVCRWRRLPEQPSGGWRMCTEMLCVKNLPEIDKVWR